ncbi:MAG: hypothetical protein K0Q63_1291 [Paenibacillus sp.]|jgi:hypothetical protein|nr:hypothetical protein [Paenibacillus sp.]
MHTKSHRYFRPYAAKGFLTLAAALVISGLTGCGTAGTDGAAVPESSAAAEQGTESPASNPFEGVSPADVQGSQGGIEQLSDDVKSLKSAVEAGDKDTATALADRMASTWLAIAEEAKGQQPERYEQIQGDLSKLLTAVQAKEWDATLLIDLDYSLYQGLRDLKQAMGY